MKKNLALVAGIVLLVGCLQDTPSGPTAEFVDVQPKNTEGGFNKVYLAGDTVTIVAFNTSSGESVPGSVISSAESAVTNWNNEIFGLAGQEGSLPHLNENIVEGTSGSGTTIELKYTDECSGSSCGYCGNFYSGSPRGFDLYHKPLTGICGDGLIVNDPTGVIVHELSHVLGFGHSSGPGTEWCVSRVIAGGAQNHRPCRWEQQAVYAAYGLRNSDPLPGKPIANRLVILPNPDTALTNYSDTIRAYGIVDPEPSESGGTSDTIFVDVDWDDLGSQYFDVGKITTSPLGRAEIDGLEIGEGTVTAEARDQANDDFATAYPWATATATIVVESGSGLNPCFREDNTHTWRNTDQYLTTGCATTGSNIRYRYRFQDGGAWTSYSADTLYEFFGHSSDETFKVTMELKDISSGATERKTHEYVVSNNIMSMSGPTYVTDKQLKTYTSNHAGKWYERWDPESSYDWNLTLGTYGDYDEYTRIWAAGEYTTLLRVEKTNGGGLGRDRLEVVVCHESIPGCGPMVWVMPGGSEVTESDARALPLFGGGPWIEAGDRIVRFYDLTGAHEPGSPFADIAWLDAREPRRATSADGRAGLTWIVKDATADTREVEFDVDGVSGAYRFGLALDPDLGKSPADDRSIYDAGSGALIAYDAGEAIGFVLRRSGQDDVAGVKQYGAREFAPRDPARLRQAIRQAGVDLAAELDDVQFVVSGSQTSGRQVWTLFIARGDDPDDVAAKLEAMVGQ